MSPVAAGLVVAWVAIIFLALVCGGLVLELRKLRSLVSRPASSSDSAMDQRADIEGRAFADEDADTRVLLMVDEACPVCKDVIPHFVERGAALPSGIAASLLTSHVWDTGLDAGWPVVTDRQLYGHLFPGWLPALVHVTREGGVRSIDPGGSPEAIDALLSRIAAPGRLSNSPSGLTEASRA